MHLLPNNDNGGRYQNTQQSELLATIKVPPALGRPGRNCQLDLPDAAYPEELAQDGAGSVYSDRYTDAGVSDENSHKPEPKTASGSDEGSEGSSKSKPSNALAEAKARGYKNGGMGIAGNGKAAAGVAPAKPLRERSNMPQRSGSKPRNEAAARRPAGAARRYVSAAQAVGKIPRAPAGRRRGGAPAYVPHNRPF